MMERPLLQEHFGHGVVQDIGRGRQCRQLAQHRLELGEVVRPAVMDQLIHGIGRQADDLLAQGGVQAVQIEVGQRRDLVGTGAQRDDRQPDAAHLGGKALDGGTFCGETMQEKIRNTRVFSEIWLE